MLICIDVLNRNYIIIFCGICFLVYVKDIFVNLYNFVFIEDVIVICDKNN